MAAAVSPLIAGYVIQKTNNWNWPFPGSMGLLLLGAILAFRMKPDELFARGELEPMPGIALVDSRGGRGLAGRGLLRIEERRFLKICAGFSVKPDLPSARFLTIVRQLDAQHVAF